MKASRGNPSLGLHPTPPSASALGKPFTTSLLPSSQSTWPWPRKGFASHQQKRSWAGHRRRERRWSSSTSHPRDDF